jgi:hypothetical protein
MRLGSGKMPPKLKMHWLLDPLKGPACGQAVMSTSTNDLAHVTCKKCRRAAKKRGVVLPG